MKSCRAVVNHGVIQFLIDQGEDGYDEFAAVLLNIEKNGWLSYYGDVTDENGQEQCGLKITDSGPKNEQSQVH